MNVKKALEKNPNPFFTKKQLQLFCKSNNNFLSQASELFGEFVEAREEIEILKRHFSLSPAQYTKLISLYRKDTTPVRQLNKIINQK